MEFFTMELYMLIEKRSNSEEQNLNIGLILPVFGYGGQEHNAYVSQGDNGIL